MSQNRDGTPQLVVSSAQHEAISTALTEIQNELEAFSVFLSHTSGLLIAHTGSLNENTLPNLSALTGADYAATNEIARLIGEQSRFKTHLHEGSERSVFISGCSRDFILIIVFPSRLRFGIVHETTNRLLTRLNPILDDVSDGKVDENESIAIRASINNQDFYEELSARLLSAFTHDRGNE